MIDSRPFRVRHAARGALALAWLCVVTSAVAGEPPEWVDCLAERGAAWAAASAGRCRLADGVLTVAAGPDDQWTHVQLLERPPAAYDLELELRWGRDAEGAVEVVLGPHAFGNSGYRIVARRQPWQAAECPGLKLAPDTWHALRLSVLPGLLECRTDGALLVRSPARGHEGQGPRLVVRAGASVSVRTCRLRAYGPEALASEESRPPRFVYPAPAFGHRGLRVADAAARGGQAIEASGRGEGEWLLWGQDGSLAPAGRYEARFGLRGVQGSGAVWLEVRYAGGEAVAARALRLEELPAAYRRVGVGFRCEAGRPLEYRLAAAAGALRVDAVTVVPAMGEERPSGQEGGRRRFRRARSLKEVWGKGQAGDAAPIRIVRLSRRLLEEGWYGFRATWSQEAGEHLDDLAVDLWVATRDEQGRIKVFDYAVAYDRVGPGQHATAARLDPGAIRRYGAPVAFFAQVYWQGVPVAAAWRKWGIPVDDKYIVEAKRAGPLHEAGGTAGGY
jgi:hypothetical protein